MGSKCGGPQCVFGYAGDHKAIAPNLDRVAPEGMRFESATCVTPVCAAHRASPFTGKYTPSTGMVINECCMNPDHDTLAYRLHDVGYNIGYLGKWSFVVRTPRSQAFELRQRTPPTWTIQNPAWTSR